MRLICAISRRASLTTACAGLVTGRSRPTISITPAMPASGLRISWASPAASSPSVARCSARDIWVRCSRSISFAALAQLLDHVVEVATEFPDFVVPIGKAHRRRPGPLRRRERSCPEGPPLLSAPSFLRRMTKRSGAGTVCRLGKHRNTPNP